MAEPVLVDCHVHVGLDKYRSVQDYLTAMTHHGIAHAVLVQYLGNTDNTYLERCVAEHPDRFTGIGLVDPDEPRTVDALAKRGLLLGVRLPARARGEVWRAMAAHGLAASITGPFTDMIDDGFLAVVDAHPGVRFRLEHLGWLRYADDPPPHHGFQRFLRLAEWPNTSVSVSGFFLNAATAYPYPDTEPFLRMALAAFGADRLMWSGDWNRADGTDTTYASAIDHVTAHMPFLSNADRDWMLGRAATAILGRDSWA